MRSFPFLFFLFLLGSVTNAQRINIPLGGNSFLTDGGKGGEKLDSNGWKNWSDPNAAWSVFIRVNRSGTVRAFWKIELAQGSSTLECRIGGQKDSIKCRPGKVEYSSRYFTINDTGYIRIEMRGLGKIGSSYGIVRSLELEGSCIDAEIAYVKDNVGNYFYWGRRGPSVHINYDLSAVRDDIEWFYSEITVPKDNDVIGSYFMANGFGEGYFGMQVNSPTERRMLFSVWSPFTTDDPSKVPDDKKIRLVSKGENVHTGEFGNEGSGGQSYLVYPWKAEHTYSFLLRAQPLAGDYTRFTAWFCEKGEKEWHLMAIFERPATHTYLKRLHSFLENFIPETGHIKRMAWYHDQWVKTSKGDWLPLTRMQFSADATARKGYRMDYRGGAGEQGFFLQNDGFFSSYTPIRTSFENKKQSKPPVLDTIRIMRH